MSNEREELLEALNDLEGVCYEYESLLPIAVYLKKHLAQLPPQPLSEEDIRTHTPFHYHDAEQKAFKAGVKYAERQHNITRCGK
jgi:hypothetical protein